MSSKHTPRPSTRNTPSIFISKGTSNRPNRISFLLFTRSSGNHFFAEPNLRFSKLDQIEFEIFDEITFHLGDLGHDKWVLSCTPKMGCFLNHGAHTKHVADFFLRSVPPFPICSELSALINPFIEIEFSIISENYFQKTGNLSFCRNTISCN